MPFFLRLLGITNAALWFGSAVFFAVVVCPAFSSSEMLRVLPRSHTGAVLQLIAERYSVVGYWCGGIAVAHLFLEALYAGRPFRRWPLFLVVGMVGWGLFTGLFVEPKLKRLHLQVYGMRATPTQRGDAVGPLRIWSGVLQVSTLFVALGLWVYVWEMNSPGTSAKLVSASKFRG